MRRMRWLVLAGLTGLVTGCGANASGSGGLSSVSDTVGGIPRLTYPGEGGIALGWATDTIARIGDVMGDDDAYQFDRVTGAGLAGDADGNIYVLDVAGKRVLSYDAAGKHRATYGRAGQGPGELTNPLALAIGPGDTIWVMDPFSTRVTGYPREEGEPRTVPLRDMNGFPNSNFTLRGSGFLVQTTAPMRMFGRGGRASFSIAGPGPRSSGRASAPPPTDTAAGKEASEPENTIPVFRIGMDGAPADTLWKSTPPPMNMMQVGGSGGGGRGNAVMVMAMAPEYQPTLRWAAFSDGGIAVVDVDRYEVSLVRPDGGVRLIVRRDLPVWPVGDAEKEAARERVRNSNIQISGAAMDMGPIIEQRLQSMTFAETVPRITKIGIDSEDRVWVGIAITKPGETERIDIFNKDGLFLGFVDGLNVPDSFFAGGRAIALSKDPDTDVQQIAVMQVRERAR